MDSHYPITGEQIAFYRENGYVQIPEVLSPDELADLRRVISKAVREHRKVIREAGTREKSDYEKVFLQMVNLWEHFEEIRPFVLSERLAEIARRLAGARSVRLFHDHALIKEPGDSRETPWHQDFPYWPMDKPGALSCWLALDNVTAGNGALSFIPGTHRLGRLKPITLGNPEDIFDQIKGKLDEVPEPVLMNMKAGSCTFHDGNTFHYAGANHTRRPRRALAIIYIPQGVNYSCSPHLVTENIGLVDGRPFNKAKFPVLARG